MLHSEEIWENLVLLLDGLHDGRGNVDIGTPKWSTASQNRPETPYADCVHLNNREWLCPLK